MRERERNFISLIELFLITHTISDDTRHRSLHNVAQSYTAIYISVRTAKESFNEFNIHVYLRHQIQEFFGLWSQQDNLFLSPVALLPNSVSKHLIFNVIIKIHAPKQTEKKTCGKIDVYFVNESLRIYCRRWGRLLSTFLDTIRLREGYKNSN